MQSGNMPRGRISGISIRLPCVWFDFPKGSLNFEGLPTLWLLTTGAGMFRLLKKKGGEGREGDVKC